MVNGRMILDQVLVHILTQMEISIRVIGIVTFSKVWVHIITLMGIFIRGSGGMVSLMAREIIFIRVGRQFTREIGTRARSRDLVSWLSRITMDIQVSGGTIRKRVKGAISTQMGKNMMDTGLEIRSPEMVHISTKMGICTWGRGRMTGGPVKAR